VAVCILGLIGVVYSNRSNIKVKLSAIVVIVLVSGVFYGIVEALASRVILSNYRFLIDRLGYFTGVK
jgi:hypothetical protein